MDDIPPPYSQVLNWGEPVETEKTVTGSVVEFTFGPQPHSYFVTSYPHRPHLASLEDRRTFAILNMPMVLEKLRRLQPRYVMNVAFRDSETWFMFCYRGSRFAYDSKWFPRKPADTAKDLLARQFEILKTHERDQISSCAFGDRPSCFFLRSTDVMNRWHPKFGHVPIDLQSASQDEDFRLLPRAVTFGWKQSWILYGKNSFEWSQKNLPNSLVRALEEGKENRWIINKAVLNRTNRKEYVLVYDEGRVYFSFHEKFRQVFEDVIAEWSAGMRASGRHPNHAAILIPAPHEELEDPTDEDDAGDLESPFEEETLADNLCLKKSSRGIRPRHSSSVSRRKMPSASPSHSMDSGISTGHATGPIMDQPLELAGANAQAERQPPRTPPTTPPSNRGGHSLVLPRSLNSVNYPERVPYQSRSPLPESKPEQNPVPSDRLQRNRQQSTKSEAWKKITTGVKDLLL